MKKAILLFSGGIDSTTLLAELLSEEYEVLLLSFDYGQEREEIDAIHALAKLYGCDLKLIHIETQNQLTEESTYVPARNTIFLAYALGYAESKGIDEIYIGAIRDDSEEYPDCRADYFEQFNLLANTAIKKGKISIKAPYIYTWKKELMRRKVDYSLCWSDKGGN